MLWCHKLKWNTDSSSLVQKSSKTHSCIKWKAKWRKNPRDSLTLCRWTWCTSAVRRFSSAGVSVVQAQSAGRDWLGLILMGWFDRYCITLKALPIFPVTFSRRLTDRATPPPHPHPSFLSSHPPWYTTYWIFSGFQRRNKDRSKYISKIIYFVS